MPQDSLTALGHKNNNEETKVAVGGFCFFIFKYMFKKHDCNHTLLGKNTPGAAT